MTGEMLHNFYQELAEECSRGFYFQSSLSNFASEYSKKLTEFNRNQLNVDKVMKLYRKLQWLVFNIKDIIERLCLSLIPRYSFYFEFFCKRRYF